MNFRWKRQVFPDKGRRHTWSAKSKQYVWKYVNGYTTRRRFYSEEWADDYTDIDIYRETVDKRKEYVVEFKRRFPDKKIKHYYPFTDGFA